MKLFHYEGMEKAFDAATGKDVRIAIVDSGIDSSHPSLGKSVKGGVDIEMISGKVITKPCSYVDAYGHGTACAGIIKEIAPEVELYSVKVLGSDLGGSGHVFLAGLKWAIENDMQIINLSLGTTNMEYFGRLHQLADKAYYKGTVLVAAANNSLPPSVPSIFASLISVKNMRVRDKLDFRFLSNNPIELGALGTEVRAPWLNQTYRTLTGTSFATPHITGIVARILSICRGITPFEMKAILLQMTKDKELEQDRTGTLSV
tara:strand:- start:14 stop:793 length:780 start_codon:yes stop_codon:yes gene_type:complete